MKRSGVRRLFSLSLRRDRWEREVEEEILTHLTIRAERLMALGMSPKEAKDEALRRFGPLDESKARLVEAAEHREESMRRQEYLAEIRQDLSFAARTLVRNKGWAAVAIITLALGIGATTAVWSAASTLLLHPLPYPDARRIVNVNLLPTTGNSTGVDVAITAPAKLIRAWQRDSRAFEALQPYSSMTRTLGPGVDGEEVVVTRVQPTFAGFAGERPLIGRNLMESDVRNRAPVALLGEALWRTRFGADPTIPGRRVRMGDETVEIVGVMPAALRTPRIGGRPTGLWMPLDLADDKEGFRLIGRLRPGIPQETAARELDSISVRAQVYEAGTLPFRATLVTPGETVSFRDSLVMLAGAVLLVLLVAAANVAHLLLARAIARQREVAIRRALGASRGRLVRQMMTETLVLTTAGCALGALLGHLALKALVRFRPPTLPELQLAHLDMTTMALVIGASIACAVVFGAVAATATSARASAGVLRSGVVAMFSRAGERFRSSLVVTEMALSATLLVGAVLLVRTVIALQQSDLGFDPTNLHAVVPDLHATRYATPAARHAAVKDLADALRAVPGVRALTITDAVPSYRNFALGTLHIEGTPMPTNQATSFIDVGRVTPSYFRTFGARLVEGRLADSVATSREIVINEGFARRHWKPGAALGKRLRIVYQGEQNEWMTIVGVVKDISSMGPVGEKSAPFLYLSMTERANPGIVYRTDGREATRAQVLAIARATLPNTRLHEHSTEKTIANTLAPSRFIMLLMAGFTVLAVILAAIGLYGMMAYAVAQRTREIGIRMALGATRETIARSVVGRGALLGVAGAVLGLALAFWGTRIIEGSLYGVHRLDAASFIAGGIGLVVIAIVASLIPMRRAVAVDPMTAIRAD